MSVTSSSTMSLTISWTIAENITVTSYTVSYSNRNLNCFNDSNSISRIPVSQRTYTLTGLEERTEYSITVTAYLPRGRTEARNVYGTTLTAGQSLKVGLIPVYYRNRYVFIYTCSSNYVSHFNYNKSENFYKCYCQLGVSGLQTSERRDNRLPIEVWGERRWKQDCPDGVRRLHWRKHPHLWTD